MRRSCGLEMPASRYIPRLTQDGIDAGRHYPQMNGREVFKHAARKLPEAVMTVLERQKLGTKDIDLFIPHQANLQDLRGGPEGARDRRRAASTTTSSKYREHDRRLHPDRDGRVHP